MHLNKFMVSPWSDLWSDLCGTCHLRQQYFSANAYISYHRSHLGSQIISSAFQTFIAAIAFDHWIPKATHFPTLSPLTILQLAPNIRFKLIYQFLFHTLFFVSFAITMSANASTLFRIYNFFTRFGEDVSRSNVSAAPWAKQANMKTFITRNEECLMSERYCEIVRLRHFKLRYTDTLFKRLRWIAEIVPPHWFCL